MLHLSYEITLDKYIVLQTYYLYNSVITVERDNKGELMKWTILLPWTVINKNNIKCNKLIYLSI